MLHPVIALIDLIFGFYGLIVFIYIIMRLLTQFEILNPYSPFVGRALKLFGDLVEPVLDKIRKYVKPIGSVDLSPVILLMAIYMVQYCLEYYSA